MAVKRHKTQRKHPARKYFKKIASINVFFALDIRLGSQQLVVEVLGNVG